MPHPIIQIHLGGQHTMLHRAHAAVSAISLFTLAGTAFGQAASWNAPVDGAWETAANWNPAVVPGGASFDVELGLTGAYFVTLDTNRAVGSLTLSNPDAVLQVIGGRSLSLIASDIQNDGEIILNSNGTVFNAALAFGVNTGIFGSGTINFGSMGAFDDAQLFADPLVTVTIGADQTVVGNGRFAGGGSYVNQGLISPNDPLGAGIQLNNTMTQTGAGQVDVTDGIFRMSTGANLIGGQIVGSGTGSVQVDGNPAIIDSLDLNAPLGVFGGGMSIAVRGTVNNNNTITLNTTNQVFNSTLTFDSVGANLAGTGNIVMITNGNVNDARINASPGITGTIGAGQTVSGSGQILNDIILEGTVIGDFATLPISITDTVTGTGTLRAIGDGAVELNSCAIDGLTVETADNGIVVARAGTSTLSNITNNGAMGIAGSGIFLSLLTDLVNDGSITVNTTGTVFNANLTFEADSALTGTGVVQMVTNGNINDAAIRSESGFTGTFGSGQTIQGSGQILGLFVNEGLIDGNDPAQGLQIGAEMSGSGSIESNGGRVNFANATIDGQTLDTSADGLIAADVGTTVITNCTNNGTLGITGGGIFLALGNTLINDGTIVLNHNENVFNATLDLETSAAINGTGDILLLSGGQFNDARIRAADKVNAVIGSGQSIDGSGELEGDITVLGNIGPGASLRQLNQQQGTLTFADSTTAEFDLGGLPATDFDQFSINNSNGNLVVDGTCVIRLDDGYTPAFGDQWEIIDGDNVTGVFDSYNTPAAGPNEIYRVFFNADGAFVRLTCVADYTGDTTLNFLDLGEFLTLFNAQDVRADLAAPAGVFNFFDLGAFLTAFNLGCP